VSAPAPATNSATDSRKLASIQSTVTPLVANISSQAITSTVDNAINDAFSNGGAPITGSANGFAINFAADPQSRVQNGANEAFNALAYADGKKPAMPVKAPPLSPRFDREWSLWADVRGTGFNSNSGANGMKGQQLNITAGLGRKVTPDWLVGVIAGYETFNYDIASLTGSLKGRGGSVGAYTGYKFIPTLRWDSTLVWSRVNYDAVAGAASGSFTGSRWIASTGLTGTYRWMSVVLEPSSKIYALWERQSSYTDSLGTAQAGRYSMAGRVATGGRVIVPWTTGNAWTLSPYLGAYADWRFGTTVTSDVSVSGISQGWSGRVTGGVAIAKSKNGSLTLGGEYGGIGANYKIWTGQARAVWAF
jgi:hypothetical protein